MVHNRYDPRGRDYFARKLAAGKGSSGDSSTTGQQRPGRADGGDNHIQHG
jgi:hypothetical protein